MPKFTIESTFRVPHYRHSTYEAPDFAAALAMAESDDDWSKMKEDFETAGATLVTGAWAGEVDHQGAALALPRRFHLLTTNGLRPYVVGPFADYMTASEWAAAHLDGRAQWLFFEGEAGEALAPDTAAGAIYGEVAS
jgi:hypothetical protein